MATSLPSTWRWMWPSSPWTRVVVWLTILPPSSSRWSSGRCWRTVWPFLGLVMMSLAGLLGRAAATAVVVAGASDPPLFPPEQAVSARPRPATASRTAVLVRKWWWGMVGPLSDDLLEPAGALGAAGGGVDGEGDAARAEVDVGGEMALAEADEGQLLGGACGAGHGGSRLRGGLLVSAGVEEGEVDGVGAGAARVDVALEGLAGGEGDGVEGRLAGDLGHLDLLGGLAGGQLHGHGDRRARALDQPDHGPAAGDRQLAALALPQPLAVPGQVEGGGADLRLVVGGEPQGDPGRRPVLARVVVGDLGGEGVGTGRARGDGEGDPHRGGEVGALDLDGGWGRRFGRRLLDDELARRELAEDGSDGQDAGGQDDLAAHVAPQGAEPPDAGGQGGHDPEAVERPERDQAKEQRHLQVEEAPVA